MPFDDCMFVEPECQSLPESINTTFRAPSLSPSCPSMTTVAQESPSTSTLQANDATAESAAEQGERENEMES